MKDLEIRGAGNLLGGEQSGHIEGVGFDLYVRMVGEAVSAFKGERPEEEAEVKIDLPVDAHLPVDYIAVERLRLEMYRKLAEARAEARLALGLLGPSRAQRLQERVDQLAVSRTDLIEAVDAERRRIERDLHDGTQQRLVSLAVNLGLAMATRPDLPSDAREVIARAHLEAKEAITELDDLVRGLHPAVLEDRGLDAALSGLAARTPLPVRLRVSLEERVAPKVESVAYFVISEALTNATKHANAMRAEVMVRQVGEVLRVRVTDDGLGGADAAAGTGLTGLAKRVGSLDGAFHVSSPVGGPTTITAELPCAR
jgi:signal transduction histidine kinase